MQHIVLSQILQQQNEFIRLVKFSYDDMVSVLLFMQKIILAFTFIFLALAVCPASYKFEDSPCKFYINYADSSCYDFTFTKCSVTQCIEYDGDQCEQTRRYNYTSWQTCTSKCCDSSVTYGTNADSLVACQQFIDSKSKSSSVGIAIGITVGIGVLMLTCCIACYCYRKRIEKIHNASTRINHMNRLNRHPSMAPLEMSSINFVNIDWKETQRDDEKFHNVCSVCLDDKPSLELQCGHIYHRKCIIACIKRKHECILCRTTQINNVKVHCQNCFQRHFDTTLMNNMDQLLKTKAKCNRCREINMMVPEQMQKDLDM